MLWKIRRQFGYDMDYQGNMACDALKIRIPFYIIVNLLEVCLHLYFMRYEFWPK